MTQQRVLSALALAVGTAVATGALIAGGALFHEAEVRDVIDGTELAAYPVQGGLNRVSAIAFDPDGAMLVAQRDGLIQVFLSPDRRAEPDASFTVPEVRSAPGAGLLSLAVDPAFAQNGYVYACASRDRDQEGPEPWQNQLLRLVVDEDLRIRVDAVLANLGRARGSQNGCVMAIDPDGYLWVARGDSRSPGGVITDNRLEGRVLRVSLAEANTVGETMRRADLKGRVVAGGLRSPVALALSLSGAVWVADAGPAGHDEVDLVEEGADFGWPCAIADSVNPAPPDGCSGAVVTDQPFWTSGGDAPFGISGMAVLSGEAWGAWQGDLIVVGRRARELRRLRSNGLDMDDLGTLFGSQHWIAGPAAVGRNGALYVAVRQEGETAIMRIAPR